MYNCFLDDVFTVVVRLSLTCHSCYKSLCETPCTYSGQTDIAYHISPTVMRCHLKVKCSKCSVSNVAYITSFLDFRHMKFTSDDVNLAVLGGKSVLSLLNELQCCGRDGPQVSLDNTELLA